MINLINYGFITSMEYKDFYIKVYIKYNSMKSTLFYLVDFRNIISLFSAIAFCVVLDFLKIPHKNQLMSNY